MKNFLYVLVLLFITAIVVSVVKFDFNAKLFSADNLNQWLVICASLCGILLSYILVRYQALKENLQNN